MLLDLLDKIQMSQGLWMHNLEIFFGNNVKLKKNVCIAKVPSH